MIFATIDTIRFLVTLMLIQFHVQTYLAVCMAVACMDWCAGTEPIINSGRLCS